MEVTSLVTAYNRYMTTYVIAGGCFWCLDAVFRRLKGVSSVISGYSGGHIDHPTYMQVSTGATGHAEAIQITFDETIIPTKIILDLFFLIHNPTTLNRQGGDVGPQYRSAMFYSSIEQKKAFTSALNRARKHWEKEPVTTIQKLESFFPAEDYHQDYFNKNPGNGYCSVVISPKIIKARIKYTKWFKD